MTMRRRAVFARAFAAADQSAVDWFGGCRLDSAVEEVHEKVTVDTMFPRGISQCLRGFPYFRAH